MSIIVDNDKVFAIAAPFITNRNTCYEESQSVIKNWGFHSRYSLIIFLNIIKYIFFRFLIHSILLEILDGYHHIFSRKVGKQVFILTVLVVETDNLNYVTIIFFNKSIS